MKVRRITRSAKGFTLIETMIALAVMAIGVLGLAGMLADSLAYMNGSQADFIAEQKAQQAVEAIFTAKYSSSITWAQVANNSVGNPLGLVFLHATADSATGTRWAGEFDQRYRSARGLHSVSRA